MGPRSGLQFRRRRLGHARSAVLSISIFVPARRDPHQPAYYLLTCFVEFPILASSCFVEFPILASSSSSFTPPAYYLLTCFVELASDTGAARISLMIGI